MKRPSCAGVVWALLFLPLTLLEHVTSAQGDRPGTEKVLVFAAASTSNAVDEIRQGFINRTGIQVPSSYASSATLAQQIVNGADADLFISADTNWAEHLAQRDLVARQQNLLGNRLVVIVPVDSRFRLRQLADLAAPEIEHIALGDPEGVPAGKYAKQALAKLGLWQPVQTKVVSAEDVRHALTFVETGAAEAGIVYATDAAISKKVKVAVEVPSNLTEPIRYPIVLLKHGADRAGSRQFYEHLRSPAAAVVFKKYGFVVLEEAGPSSPSPRGP